MNLAPVPHVSSRGRFGDFEMDSDDVKNRGTQSVDSQRAIKSSRFIRCTYVLLLVALCYIVSFFVPMAPLSLDTMISWIKHFSPIPIPSIEERAMKILAKNPLIDGHNDLAILIRVKFGNEIYHPSFTEPFESGVMPQHVDLPRLDAGKVGGAFWSAFLPCQKDIFDFSDSAYEAIVHATLSQLDLYHRLGAKYPHYFTPPLTASSALHNWQHNNRALISPLAIEGLHQIGNSLSTLRMYHALGVRYATLTWNCHNAYADAAVLTFFNNGSSIKAPPYWHGVSNAGRGVIHEMNRLGMLVDISHVSTNTMRDVLIGNCSASESASINTMIPSPNSTAWTGSIAPPIFSHSSAYAICPHPRNVPDSILQLVKQRNALVMINFSPDFISCIKPPANSSTDLPEHYPPNSTLAQVVRHIMHIGELIGYDHVGLGSDFDGIEDGPKGLEDVSKYPKLVEELLRQGVSEDDIAKIVGRNILRVWNEADRVSKEMSKKGWLPLEDKLKLPFENLQVHEDFHI